jgi:outer membrane protein OmpA-like peptidoglycan-associated protein
MFILNPERRNALNIRLVFIVCMILFAVFYNISFSHDVNAQTILVDKVVNIGPPVNSSKADFAPSFTADGKTLVFNSKRGRRNYQDIYISHFRDGAWTNPRPMHEINSRYNDESPYITPDGAFIFFSSDRDGSFEMAADESGLVRVSFDLYVSRNVNGRWDFPIKVPGTVNTIHHERTPSLSLDSNTIYYTSMPFGDVSRARIMKAEYSNGEFLNPVPLPEPININAQDTGLIPSPDGKGFYFSSRREGGFGGWDLYFVKYEDGIFGKPVNLGGKINSAKNEINLSVINGTIFFCSDRPGGYGSYDVYTSGISVEDDTLKIIVRDKKTKIPVQTEMKIRTEVRESEDKTVTYEIKKKTDEKGEARVKYNPAVTDLDIEIDEEGYLPLFERVNIPSLKGSPAVIELVPVEKEASFNIHSIYFDFESSRIRPESYPYLDALAEYLKKHPSIRFEIIGHTDLHGADEFNDKLSLERAEAVRDYLAGKGIDKNRFEVRGAGKRRPLVPESGPGFDERNRRTEFRVLEK